MIPRNDPPSHIPGAFWKAFAPWGVHETMPLVYGIAGVYDALSGVFDAVSVDLAAAGITTGDHIFVCGSSGGERLDLECQAPAIGTAVPVTTYPIENQTACIWKCNAGDVLTVQRLGALLTMRKTYSYVIWNGVLYTTGDQYTFFDNQQGDIFIGFDY